MERDAHSFPWSFILVAYGFSWVFWIPIILIERGMTLPPGLVDFLNSPLNPAAFGPTLAAFMFVFVQAGWPGVKKLLRSGVDLRFRKIWLLPILVMPPVIFIGATLLSVLLGATALDLAIVSDPPMMIISFFVILLTAGPLQEEFGWRGYALPRLQERYTAIPSSIILGIVWWLWHLPVVFIPGRFMTGSLWLFGLLGIEITLMTIVFTWIHNNTGGSVLAALLLHTAMNWSIWVLLPTMQMNATIIGITIGLLCAVVAVILRTTDPKTLIHAPVG